MGTQCVLDAQLHGKTGHQQGGAPHNSHHCGGHAAFVAEDIFYHGAGIEVEFLVEPPLLKEKPLAPGGDFSPEQVYRGLPYQLGAGEKRGCQKYDKAERPREKGRGPGKGQRHIAQAELWDEDIQGHIFHNEDAQKPSQQSSQNTADKVIQGVVLENLCRGEPQGFLGANERPLLPDNPCDGCKGDDHRHQQK